MRCQIFTRCGEPEISFVSRLPNELFQEDWSFEPPVPKQFRIERSDNNRVETDFADFANLLAALFEKLNRMFCRRLFGRRPVIQLFIITASGNPMIFHAGEFSGSAGYGSQLFHWKIETDVAIKFPVSWITRITFVRIPDLAACVGIARKSRGTRWRITGNVNRAARSRFSKERAMCIENEPAKIGFLQNGFEIVSVTTFG